MEAKVKLDFNKLTGPDARTKRKELRKKCSHTAKGGWLLTG